jgi:short-subunit dehydrogenase
VVRLNVLATMTICHAYLNVARAGDALVNVASGTGFLPLPYGAVYSGTKAFLINFSEALWFEQRRRGIYVMAFVPGLTYSQFHERAGGTDENAPPKFLWESAEAVAETAARALHERRRPTVLSGALNKAWTFTSRILDRKGLVSMMGGVWDEKWNKPEA